MKSPCQNQLDSSSRFNTTSACDGQTDGRTHDDNIYRASTASRGKKNYLINKSGVAVLGNIHNQRDFRQKFSKPLKTWSVSSGGDSVSARDVSAMRELRQTE